jgi:hypothetical protein
MSQASAGDVTSNLNELEQDPPRSKLRLRFSLLALFVFVTVACLALTWLVQPRRVVATAWFRVAMAPPTLIGDETIDRFDEQEFELFKNTQRAMLKSPYVLEAAFRQPGIASLPVLASKKDPAAWLQEHLEVDFPEDGELMAIRLRGPESATNDLKTVVDAVAIAYGQAASNHEASQWLSRRDERADVRRALESEVASALQRLNDQVVESGEKARESTALKLQQLEADVLIEQLQELRRREKRDELNARSPSRIELVQPAVVSPE